MPEIKHNFTGGKMNKDLDERLVPKGEYTEAMNVQVSTSDNSEVGTVQNLLSNHKIQGNIQDQIVKPGGICIGSVADEKNDALYWFLRNPTGVETGGNIEDVIMTNLISGDGNVGNIPPEGYFDSTSTGDAIVELKDNIITPVVIEHSKVFSSLINAYQQSTLINLGGGNNSYLTTYSFNVPPAAAGLINVVMYL